MEWEFEPDLVAALVREAFGAEFEYEDRDLFVQGNRLLVAAPSEVQARVEAFLTALEAQVGVSSEVTIDVLELPAGSPARGPERSVLSEREALDLIESLAAAAENHQSFRLRIVPGRTSVLDMTHTLQLVNDYDVEIAQGAWIFDPMIEEVAVGTKLLARGTPIDGGLALSVLLHSSDVVRGPYERRLGAGGMISAEQGNAQFRIGAEVFLGADILGHNLALDTALPDGHALALEAAMDIRGHAGRRLFVLRRSGAAIEPASGVASGEGWALWAVNREAAVPPRVQLWGWPLFGEHGLPRTLRARSMDEGLVAMFVSEFDSFGFGGMQTPEGANATEFGAWIVTVASSAPSDTPSVWASTPDLVDVRLALHAAGEDPHEAVSISLPVRVGESGTAVLGVERQAVSDYYVEVAQYSSASDPVVSTVFDGLLVHVRPSRLFDGSIAIDLRARGHLLSGEQRRAALDSFAYEAVELDSFDRLFLDERVVVTASGEGARVVLGDAAGGKSGSLALEVGVR
jgi:hypothetical protein